MLGLADAETAVEQYLRRREECESASYQGEAPAATSGPDGSQAESRYCGKVALMRLMSVTVQRQVFIA